jgi:hypothetical protein
MDAAARRALGVIRQCLRARRYRVARHFTERMDKRGLFWLDIEGVVADPVAAEDAGLDQFGHPKWILGGKATDGSGLGIVCVLDADEDGNLTVFITAYWD